MTVSCRICRTRFPTHDAADRIRLGERTCYFCCEACRRSFHEHPDLFPEAIRLRNLSRGVGQARLA